MLVSVTNLSSTLTLNALATTTNGSVATTGVATLVATGGQREYPLPYPFNDIVLAPSAAFAVPLPINQQDWRHKPIVGQAFEPVQEWAALISEGLVSMTFSAQAGVVDPEDKSTNTI